MERVWLIIIIGGLMSITGIRIDGQPVISTKTHNEFTKDIRSLKAFPQKDFHQMKSMNGVTQKPDSLIEEMWDTATSTWINVSRQLYYYDAYGNSDAIDYRWDTTYNKWAGQDEKFTTYYDRSGNETIHLIYLWDKSKRMWKLRSKDEIAYDGLGNVTYLKSYYVDYYTNLMTEYWREDNNLDGSGRTISTLQMYWDATSEEWIHSWKTEFSYYEAGKASSKSFNWYTDENQWVPVQWWEYRYDSSGRKTTETSYWYSGQSFQWIPYTKYEYLYDSNGKETYIIYYYFDDATSQWTFGEKMENIYNTEGKLLFNNYYVTDPSTDELALISTNEFGYDSQGNNTSQTSFYLDMTSGAKIYGWRDLNYYSEHQIVSEIPPGQVNVYPNPATEYIVFDVDPFSEQASVDLFSSQGNKIHSQDLLQCRQVNVSHFARGLYLYKVTQGGITCSGKIILN
jgi:hypothetical protein